MKRYDWDKIKKEYELGKPLNAISKQFGCNRASIRKHAISSDWSKPEFVNVRNISHAELYKLSPRYKFTVDKYRSLHKKFEGLKVHVERQLRCPVSDN